MIHLVYAITVIRLLYMVVGMLEQQFHLCCRIKQGKFVDWNKSIVYIRYGLKRMTVQTFNMFEWFEPLHSKRRFSFHELIMFVLCELFFPLSLSIVTGYGFLPAFEIQHSFFSFWNS